MDDLPNDVKNVLDIRAMFFYFSLDCRQFVCEFRIGSEDLPEFCESSHDGDIDLYCLLALKDARQHCDALFGKYVG